MNRLFKRKIYDEMLSWKDRSNGSSALLIEGARRVGKSTVVREFASKEYETKLILDFNNLSRSTRTLFENGLEGDVDTFLMKLLVSENASLRPRNGVIVFDEVQLCTNARRMIKYLVADGRYDYIETGSLITLVSRQKDYQIPSEEDHIKMHPMDFEEFLWAQGDTVSSPYLREMFEKGEPLGDAFHSKFMSMFREYLVIGGMPGVVSAYLPSKNLEDADRVKSQIINLYRSDMEKLTNATGSKVRKIFDSIPSMLAMHDKRFSPGAIQRNTKTRAYLNSVTWLSDAMITNVALDVTDPSPALDLSVEDEIIKCYLLDTGLLVHMAFSSNLCDRAALYNDLILGRLSVNEGMFFENMVSQMLTARGHDLRFCKFEAEDPYSDNGMVKHYEIDFLLTKRNKLVPVEVKSSRYSRYPSMKSFRHKYPDTTGECYLIHTRDLKCEDGIKFIPAYMVQFI